MKKLSQNELSELTGFERRTVRKRLAGMAHENGAHGAKLYDSAAALERLYRGGTASPDGISNLEAMRLLNVAKREHVVLQNEILRKERIPIEDIEEIYNSVFSNVVGMLKQHIGKELTGDSFRDILTEFRTIGTQCREGSPKPGGMKVATQ